MTDTADRDYIRAHLSDKWWRMDHLYMIENEQGELVQFKLRPVQRLLFTLMWWLNDILKARQLGFSTAIDIWLLDEALFNRNLKCGIIAQDQKAAGEIFRTKIEVPYDNLPHWLKAALPTIRRRGGSQGGFMLFKNGSSIQVANSFRSGTMQRLHVSEHGKICARYPDKAKEVRTGTLNTIHEGCIAFIESTAEGVGGDYYDLTMRALYLQQTNAELSRLDWKFHFFAWWQDPKYRSPVPAGGLILSTEKQEYFASVEAIMHTTIDDEQRQWYITKEIEQKGEMKQEFPSTPLEAFLTSGRRVFDVNDTMRAEADCIPPLIVYDINPETGKTHKMRRPAELDEQGQQTLLNRLLVWELPDEAEDYAIGADVAEGLEHGDRSSLDVIKRTTGEQVAHWHGHLDAERFAHLLAHIGTMYNKAYIGPERNNHGHAVLQKLRELYPVRRIYAEEYLDRDSDDDTPRLGWLTTKQSKPVVTEGLKTLLHHGCSGIRWIGTITEMTSYVYDPRGSMNAQEGCYDDQVMSYAIAQEMRARMPVTVKPAPRKPNNSHWMTR